MPVDVYLTAHEQSLRVNKRQESVRNQDPLNRLRLRCPAPVDGHGERRATPDVDRFNGSGTVPSRLPPGDRTERWYVANDQVIKLVRWLSRHLALMPFRLREGLEV